MLWYLNNSNIFMKIKSNTVWKQKKQAFGLKTLNDKKLIAKVVVHVFI